MKALHLTAILVGWVDVSVLTAASCPCWKRWVVEGWEARNPAIRVAVHDLTASHFLLWPPDVLERSGGDFRKGAEGTRGWESID